MRLESHTDAKGALNVMNPNIYLDAIVFYGLAQHDQMQKAVPEADSGGSTSLTSRAPPGRAINRKTPAGPQRRSTISLTPSRPECRRAVRLRLS